jgi:hypothetical protein
MSRLLVSITAAGLALALTTHAAASGLSLQVGDFNAADWALINITDDGPDDAGMVIDANLGNPGSHWVISYVSPRSTGTYSAANRLGAIYAAQSYDPAQSGTLQALQFSADISGLSSSFAFDTMGYIRPALMQNGVVYTVIGSDFVGSKAQLGQYLTKQWSFAATAADWVTAVAGSTQHPDFSAAGAPIYTGFRYALGTSCSSASGCRGGSAFLSLDNFAATLTPVAAAVPEPSTWLLWIAGLGLTLVRRRA